MECITGPISRIISSKGMPAVYEALDTQGKETFKQVWSPILPLSRVLLCSNTSCLHCGTGRQSVRRTPGTPALDASSDDDNCKVGSKAHRVHISGQGTAEDLCVMPVAPQNPAAVTALSED